LCAAAKATKWNWRWVTARENEQELVNGEMEKWLEREMEKGRQVAGAGEMGRARKLRMTVEAMSQRARFNYDRFIYCAYDALAADWRTKGL